MADSALWIWCLNPTQFCLFCALDSKKTYKTGKNVFFRKCNQPMTFSAKIISKLNLSLCQYVYKTLFVKFNAFFHEISNFLDFEKYQTTINQLNGRVDASYKFFNAVCSSNLGMS